jgi:hypothetical protein
MTSLTTRIIRALVIDFPNYDTGQSDITEAKRLLMIELVPIDVEDDLKNYS